MPTLLMSICNFFICDCFSYVTVKLTDFRTVPLRFQYSLLLSSYTLLTKAMRLGVRKYVYLVWLFCSEESKGTSRLQQKSGNTYLLCLHKTKKYITKEIWLKQKQSSSVKYLWRILETKEISKHAHLRAHFSVFVEQLLRIWYVHENELSRNFSSSVKCFLQKCLLTRVFWQSKLKNINQIKMKLRM